MEKLNYDQGIIGSLASLGKAAEDTHNTLLDMIEDDNLLFRLAADIFGWLHESNTSAILNRLDALYQMYSGESLSGFDVSEHNDITTKWLCQIFIKEMADRLFSECNGREYELSYLTLAENVGIQAGDASWLVQ